MGGLDFLRSSRTAFAVPMETDLFPVPQPQQVASVCLPDAEAGQPTGPHIQEDPKVLCSLTVPMPTILVALWEKLGKNTGSLLFSFSFKIYL